MLSCFHLIPECYGQTDGRTDRQICHINIARQSRVSMLTRDKNPLKIDKVIAMSWVYYFFGTQCTLYFVLYAVTYWNRKQRWLFHKRLNGRPVNSVTRQPHGALRRQNDILDCDVLCVSAYIVMLATQKQSLKQLHVCRPTSFLSIRSLRTYIISLSSVTGPAALIPNSPSV